MPEGPEIKLAADRLGAILERKSVEDVFFAQPRLSRYTQALEGQRVTSVRPRGKAMLIHFDNDLTLYSHNQLYGRWYVCERGQQPKTNRTLRVALHTHHHSALLYSASNIEVLSPVELAEHGFLNRIGPDVLDEGLDWRAIAERLQAPTFSGRELASLYLNQNFLAGIGNYLRSEILFDAKVWPWQKSAQLTRGAAGAVARSTLVISHRAYAAAGVTNPARRARRLQREGAGFESYRFAVFGRDGLACYLCSTPIIKTRAASRRLYYCPVCQAAPPTE